MIVNHGGIAISTISSSTPNILLLGGTTEATALAMLLAEARMTATLSYAGRTANPRPQPIPVRVGGFGGVDGLVDYVRSHRITHVVDATHPFAATMSAHAVEAAARTNVALAALTRPAWTPGTGDRWTQVADIAAAVAALDGPGRRIMLALGRQHVASFSAQPHHHYILRFVDAPDHPPPLPLHSLIVDRGPFTVDGDSTLMQAHRVDLVLCKNAGGPGAAAKLAAARQLGLPVLMIDRPWLPDRLLFEASEDVLRWIGHAGIDRGV